MTEALIGNDMRQMGKVVQQVVDNTNNPVGRPYPINNAVFSFDVAGCGYR